MANAIERWEGREHVGEAISVLFTTSRNSVTWGIRNAGDIAVEAVDVGEQVAKKVLQTSRLLGHEVITSLRFLMRDLPVGVIEGVRHVLGSTSDALKGGIRETAEIGAAAAASMSRVAHETTQATQRVAGDVTEVARAGIDGAMDMSRAAGATGVRVAQEVLGGLVGGVRGVGSVRPFRLRAAASSSSHRSTGRVRRRAVSAKVATS
jgi:hypothetical protein